MFKILEHLLVSQRTMHMKYQALISYNLKLVTRFKVLSVVVLSDGVTQILGYMVGLYWT